MIIELIYFEGCPNITAAKANIKKACELSKNPAEIKEWEQGNKDLPEYAKGYGSPTVLINGKDIDGEKGDCCSHGSCRIYSDMTGIPSVDLIKTAIENS